MYETLTKVRNINKTVKDYNKHKKNMLIESNQKHNGDKNLDKECADNRLDGDYINFIDEMYKKGSININPKDKGSINKCNNLIKMHLVDAKQADNHTITYYLNFFGNTLLNSIKERTHNWVFYFEIILGVIFISALLAFSGMFLASFSLGNRALALGLPLGLISEIIGVTSLFFAKFRTNLSTYLTESKYLFYMKHHLNHHDYMIVKKLFRNKEC